MIKHPRAEQDNAGNPSTAATSLETAFLERIRRGRPVWLPEVREALEMLEIAEENAGCEHVRVLDDQAA